MNKTTSLIFSVKATFNHTVAYRLRIVRKVKRKWYYGIFIYRVNKALVLKGYYLKSDGAFLRAPPIRSIRRKCCGIIRIIRTSCRQCQNANSFVEAQPSTNTRLNRILLIWNKIPTADNINTLHVTFSLENSLFY